MKKFLAVLLTMCMLMSVVMIPVSAAVEVDGKEIEGDDTSYVAVSDGSSTTGWAGGTVNPDSSTVNNGKTANAVRFDFVANGKAGQSFYIQYTAPAAKDISKMQYLAFDLWVDTAETAKILNQHQFMFELTSAGKADTSEINTGAATFLKVWGQELSVGWNHVRIPVGAYLNKSGGDFDATKWNFFRIYNMLDGNGFTDGYKYSYMVDNLRFEATPGEIPLASSGITTNSNAGTVGFQGTWKAVDVTAMTHLCFDIDVPEGTNLESLNTKEFRFELRNQGGNDYHGETELSGGRCTWKSILDGNLLHEGTNHVKIPLDYFYTYGARRWDKNDEHSNGADYRNIAYIRIYALNIPLTYSNFRFVNGPLNSADPLMASTCADAGGTWKGWDGTTAKFDTSITDKSSDGAVAVTTSTSNAANKFLMLTFERAGLDVRGYRYMEFDLYVKSAAEGVTDDAVAEAFSKISLEFEVRSYNDDNLELRHNGSLEKLTGVTLHGGWNHVVVDLSKLETSGVLASMPYSNFGALRIRNNTAISGNVYATTMYFDNLVFTKEAGDETVTRAATSKATAEASKQYVMRLNLGGKYDLTNRDTVEFDLAINNEADVEKFNSYNNFNLELTSSGTQDHLEICYVGALKQYVESGAFKAGVNHVAVPLSVFTKPGTCSGDECKKAGHYKDSANFFCSDNWEFDPTRCNFMRLFTGTNFASDAANTVELSNVKFTGKSGYPFKDTLKAPETPDEPGEKTEIRHETYTFVSNGFGEANADEFRYLRDATVFGAPNAYANIETGTGARYADKTNKIIYAFPIANYKTATALKLTGMFANQFGVEVAVAPVGASAAELQSLTWVSVFNKGTEKLPKNTIVDIPLDAILPTLKTMTGDVTLYVRIGDADTSDGWGGYIAAGSTVTFDVTYEVKTGDTVTTEIGVWQGYLPGSSITAEEWKEWRAATGDALTAKSDELNKKYGGAEGKEVTNFLANGYLLKGSQANFNPNHNAKWSKLYHDDVGAEYAQVFAYTMDKVGEVVDVEWNAFVSGHLKLQVYVGPKVADVASIPADAAWVTLYDHSVAAGEHANDKYLAETSTQALKDFHKILLETVKANLSETNNTIYIRQYNPCTKGYGGGVHTFAPQNFMRTAVGLSIRMIGERAEVDLREGGKVTINTDGLSVNHGTECSLDGTPAEVVGTVTNAENITGLTYEYIWMTEANVKLDAAPTKGGRYKVGIKVADNAKGYYGYAELPVFEIAHQYTDNCDDTCDICGEKTREASHDWKFLGREAVTPTKENGWASATIHRHCDRCGTDDPNFVISREPNVILHPEYWKNSVGTIGTAELGDRIGGKGIITYTANVSAAASFRPLAKLAEPVDISDMEYLVFDLYVPAAAVKMFNEKLFELELTSSGGPDNQEDTFRGTIAGLAGKPIVEGWNHVVLPLSSFVGKGAGGLNKSGWNFIRLFNHEKWDAAATITVGIANFHFTTDLESDFSKTIIFKALTDEEKNYLDSSAKGAENSGRDTRYADKDNKFIYKYSLGTGVADLTGIYWSAPTSGQLKLEVGVAAAGGTPTTYYPVYTYPVASAGNDKDTGLSAMLRAYDLLAVLKENNVTLADNNVIFVKISDADTATGNGGAVKNISNVALTLEYKMPTEHDGDMHIVTGAYGENQHWKWCVSCNAVVGEKADHTLDSPCDPDCNDDCGYVREVAHVTDGDIYDYVGTEHWQLCLKCGERINRGDHTFDNECDASCNLCGFERNVRHTTDGKWFFDVSGHWMICQDCNERVDFAAHKYENLCGGTCEICGFVHAVEHTWADEMGMDEHNHWYVCAVCGEKDEVTAHVFDNDCDKDCNVCGYVREVEHKFDTKWSSNGAGHYHACVNCGEPDKIIAHTFSNECDEDCDVCGYVRTATHVTSGTWEHDGEDHWKVCTKCGKKVDLAVHVFDNACDADCNICGMTREVEHTFGEKYVSDEDGHWRVCEKCGTKEAAQAHVFGDGCGTTCDVCGYVRGKVDHVFNGEWTFDENNHWHACSVCGDAVQDSAAHTWNAGKAAVGGVTVHTCTVCGAIKTVKADSERPAPDVKPADDTVQLPADIAVVIEDVTPSIADKVEENIKNGLENNKTVIEALGKNAEVVSHFDVSLVSGGAKVQPDGKVKVTIPASAYEYKNGVDYLVVYVDEDGNITPCETTQHEDGTLEFTTDHFSHYAIVGNTTSGGAPVWVFILIGVVAIAAVAAIVVVTMKKKKAKA